jgi:hypothetical protein
VGSPVDLRDPLDLDRTIRMGSRKVSDHPVHVRRLAEHRDVTGTVAVWTAIPMAVRDPDAPRHLGGWGLRG